MKLLKFMFKLSKGGCVLFILFSNTLEAQTNIAGGSNLLTDPRDKKTYKTVLIGTQTWMAENLAYKTSGYCVVYDNDSENLSKYGYLYDLLSAKNVCPSGWHLPDSKEFDILLKYVKGNGNNLYNDLTIGGSSGFSALFAGASGGDKFWGMSEDGGAGIARFISSSSVAGNGARSLCLFGSNRIAGMGSSNGTNCGYSVRCIKDN